MRIHVSKLWNKKGLTLLYSKYGMHIQEHYLLHLKMTLNRRFPLSSQELTRDSYSRLQSHELCYLLAYKCFCLRHLVHNAGPSNRLPFERPLKICAGFQ